MHPPSEAAETAARRRLQRFTRGQVVAHALTAALALACFATAAALYVDPISAAVGQRQLVRTVHLWAGYLLPVPVVLALLMSAAMRRDAREVDRFTAADRAWLRSSARRRASTDVGRFNAGQKLNASVSAAAVLVLLVSGTVLLDAWGVWSLSLRQGATFVHDWVALAFFVLVLGHLRFALRDGEAMRGAVLGHVDAGWAEREHPLWARSLEPSAGVAQPGGDAVDAEQQGAS